jgi:hypothetical protein
MPGVMSPDAAQSAMKIIKSVTMEEVAVQQDSSAKPIRSPTPSKAAPQSPAASKIEAEIDAGQERESHANTGIKQWRIIAKKGWAPNPLGIVYGNINHAGLGRRNVDRRLTVIRLRCHPLLGRRLQFPVGLRLGAQALHGTHHVRLLGQERVAQVRGPADVLIQARQYIGKRNQCLDARIPVLLPGRVHQLLTFQVAVLLQPLLHFHHFDGIRGSDQDLAQQSIRVERDGRH